jgi:hypothetical protein
MLTALLYIYLTGAVGITAAGSYGCYSGALSGNQVAIGVEGPLCYVAVTGAGLTWPIIGTYILVNK